MSCEFSSCRKLCRVGGESSLRRSAATRAKADLVSAKPPGLGRRSSRRARGKDGLRDLLCLRLSESAVDGHPGTSTAKEVAASATACSNAPGSTCSRCFLIPRRPLFCKDSSMADARARLPGNGACCPPAPALQQRRALSLTASVLLRAGSACEQAVRCVKSELESDGTTVQRPTTLARPTPRCDSKRRQSACLLSEAHGLGRWGCCERNRGGDS